jgi:hypothetical protein
MAGYPRPVRRSLALIAIAAVAAGCSKGRVSNDDSVSRNAAEQTVERFFTAIHDGHAAAACAQIPGQQRGGLARLSASRGGPKTCAGALQTLREFAAVRAPGALTFAHDIGFRSALPHKSKAAVDDVSLRGRPLGSIGLRRHGDTWSVAVVCNCP